MSMEKPLGIGPMVFSTMFPEDEHNIWLKSVTSYGWLGFVSYVTLIIWTVTIGFRFLLLDRRGSPTDDRLDRADRPCRHRQRHRYRPLAAFFPAVRRPLGLRRPGTPSSAQGLTLTHRFSTRQRCVNINPVHRYGAALYRTGNGLSE